ncbi:MAG: DNA recombination protein RmuC [Solirubrobacterales bacterium]
MELVLLTFLVLVVIALAVYVVVLQPRQEAARNKTMLEEFARTSAAQEQELENRLLKTQTQLSQEQTQSFLEMAKAHLKQETELGAQSLKQRQTEIDKGLESIRTELKNVREFVTNTDKERVESIGQVAEAVKESRHVTEALRQDTAKLNEALSGSQSRGQWGERIAEDVLRIAGFIEGVNYRKQQTTGEGSRPDFTFLLPDDRTLHMDVKMPMAAFKRYLDAPNDGERDVAAKEFLRDAKQRIKEVTTRDYINPSEGTLDYTLVFIPNEQVYGFIHEKDPTIVDYALQNHVVICSPLTLFAVLAVMRQALENFRLEARTKEIQDAIGRFRKQWDMFTAQMGKVDNQIRGTDRHWSELMDKRQRLLDDSIRKVDALRSGEDDGLAIARRVDDEILELASVEAEVLAATGDPDGRSEEETGDDAVDDTGAPHF